MEPPNDDDQPLIVAVAAPCRSYAAVFLAVGVILGRAQDEAHRVLPDEHFRALVALPPGTPVLWKHGNRVLKGVLQGTSRHSGCDFVKVQVGNAAGGRKTRLVRKDTCSSIRIADHAGKLPKKQTGRRVKGVTSFLRSWLGPEAESIVERDRSDCVIIGRRSALEAELTQKRFFIEGPDDPERGSLNEVVRAKSLVTSTSNHRAQVRTHRQGLPGAVTGPEPPILLFDGALGFLKTRPTRAQRHSVIVLDRSEPRFEDAVDVVMGTFHERGTRAPAAEEGLEAPPGLEILAFREN